MVNKEKNPLSMRDGLGSLRGLAQERVSSQGSAVILIFGDTGAGKSTLAEIIKMTRLGISLNDSPLVYSDDCDSEAAFLFDDLQRGELPSGLPSLTAFTRLTSGLVAKNYGVGREVVFVELACDRETQIQNLTRREYERAKAVGAAYNPESIEQQLLASRLDLIPLDIRRRSRVYADILLDTTAGNRIDTEEAIRLLSNL